MMYTHWAVATVVAALVAVCGIVCSAILAAAPQAPAAPGSAGKSANPNSARPPPAPTHARAFDVPSIDSPALDWWRESMKTHDQRIGWWREARFGMFIHWGVYSRLGGVWHGEPVQGYAEHIMRKSRIPLATYRSE